MKMSKTVKEYFAALERLKQNVPTNSAKNSPINKDTVAMEAGRKRGSIRLRPGFESLITAIEVASKQPRPAAKKRILANPSQTAEIELLRRDLDVARSRYMSLLFLNAEMSNTIRQLGGEVPKFSKVLNMKVDPCSTDIPC